jgi:hypothetical protein
LGRRDVNPSRGRQDKYANSSKRKPRLVHMSGLQRGRFPAKNKAIGANKIALIGLAGRPAVGRRDGPRRADPASIHSAPGLRTNKCIHKFTLHAPQTTRTIPVLGRMIPPGRTASMIKFSPGTRNVAQRATVQWSSRQIGITARPLLMRCFEIARRETGWPVERGEFRGA